jgi:uncharacterized membrane protein YwaF
MFDFRILVHTLHNPLTFFPTYTPLLPLWAADTDVGLCEPSGPRSSGRRLSSFRFLLPCPLLILKIQEQACQQMPKGWCSQKQLPFYAITSHIVLLYILVVTLCHNVHELNLFQFSMCLLLPVCAKLLKSHKKQIKFNHPSTPRNPIKMTRII